MSSGVTEIAFDEEKDGDGGGSVQQYNAYFRPRGAVGSGPKAAGVASPPPFTRKHDSRSGRGRKAFPSSERPPETVGRDGERVVYNPRRPPLRPALAADALPHRPSAGPGTADGPTAAARLPMPTFTPGSPVDLAITSSVRVRSKLGRPRKPKLFQILKHGEVGYEKKKREKQMSKKIDENHAQYHLSFGMMLGIYVSVGGGGISVIWAFSSRVFPSRRPARAVPTCAAPLSTPDVCVCVRARR